jgi:uncharacterized protein DUF4262
MEHDSRCDGADDEKVVSDVAEYGWHVVKIPDDDETPGWAFSIGLYKNFNHPEIVVFGLDDELMHFVINSVGEDVRRGKSFAADGLYPDLIEAHTCTFKPVSKVWYGDFLGYANWFYEGENYPALQCIWPDKNNLFPWDPQFNPHWVWAQPLLFHEDAESARTVALLESMAE